ncbi:helix-turn-helix domain-containing protein [Bacteroidales bacterium OttesenSCG-928-K22]|nr:helix-turn-helix domain-containing protein [Bacteroidales bacterium OttesenSCG-928-K22]
MLPELSKIKGIHPGVILKREIKLLGIKYYEFSKLINEYPQTLSSILKGKRGINPNLSIKLGEIFNVDKDYFMLLQASYDVVIADKLTYNFTPDLSKFRKYIFWDTDFDRINWMKNRRAIIKRIIERGNDTEINEIIHFYGIETIRNELKNIKSPRIQSKIEHLKNHEIF